MTQREFEELLEPIAPSQITLGWKDVVFVMGGVCLFVVVSMIWGVVP